MSKAVLVIDMPKTCYECPLCDELESCLGTDTNTIDVDILKGKPGWCPLRPLPKKRSKGFLRAVDTGKYIKAEFSQVAVGWNACLREIGGE